MENEHETVNNTQSAIEAGMRAANPFIQVDDEGNSYFRVPDGFTVEKVAALDPKLPGDVRQRETLIEQAAFCEYVNRFKTGSTIVRAKPSAPAMTAVLNYHGESKGEKASPMHCNHVAEFACDFDENWKRWRGIHGREMSQVDFAYFIEEMLHTIGEPNGADLLDMAENLKINRGVVFQNNKRLSNGTVDIQYKESDEATVGKSGNVAIPEEIQIVSPIYMLREPQVVKAKLRYRVEKGEPLRFRVDILNRDLIELEAFRVMAEEVANAVGCPVYLSR